MRKIRIKRYLNIFKIQNELNFSISPFVGVKMQDSELMYDIIDYLKMPNEYEEVVKNLQTKIQVDRKYIEFLLERLINSGIIEYIDQNEELESYKRYDRQLHFFDTYLRVGDRNDLIEVQKKISNSHVVVLGVGGIGNYASIALASAGIGQITLIDGDVIELSNLNRQFLFSESDIGKIKIDIVKERILSYNSKIKVENIIKQIETEDDFKSVFNNLSNVDFVLVSADRPRNLINWVDNYSKSLKVPFIPCGYMGNQGVVGPLVDNTTKRHNEICPIPEFINSQKNQIQEWNTEYYNPPSLGCTNGILSNIATFEIIKYITGICLPISLGKRIVVDLETFNFKEL